MTQNQATARTFEVVTDPKEDSLLAALLEQSPCAVKENMELARPDRKSAGLPSAIRRSLAADANAAIMFTSAYAREGAPGIAFKAARSAARQSTGKVLYIHVSGHIPKYFRDIQNKIPVALDDFVNTGGGKNVLPFVVLDNSGLVCASFRGRGEKVSRESLNDLMSSVRMFFELTVIGSDDMLANGASMTFSNLVDGTILVTEAERTRAPVARRLKQTVEENGGKVIGAILNRRKYYIPGWIYQILYGGGR